MISALIKSKVKQAMTRKKVKREKAEKTVWRSSRKKGDLLSEPFPLPYLLENQ